MTPFNRRSFLWSSCLAVCAGVLSSGNSLAAAVASSATRTLAEPLFLTPTEEALLAFVKTYAGSVRFIGAGVLAKLRGGATREAHWLVEVKDAAVLAGKTPFGGSYSEGNTLCFERDGIEFSIENLLPEAFAQRLTEVVTIKTIAFAHDALTYDPETQIVTDPFGAEKSRTVKLVNTTLAGGAAIGTAMRGRFQASRLGIGPDGKFSTWQSRNFGLQSSTRTAQAVAEAFLGKIATLANSLTPAAMKTLLRSRAVSTSLKSIFGLKVATAIADYDRRRRAISGEFSNAALWLSVLLGPEIESEATDGAATTWLRRGTRFDRLRSRKALEQARLLPV